MPTKAKILQNVKTMEAAGVPREKIQSYILKAMRELEMEERVRMGQQVELESQVPEPQASGTYQPKNILTQFVEAAPKVIEGAVMGMGKLLQKPGDAAGELGRVIVQLPRAFFTGETTPEMQKLAETQIGQSLKGIGDFYGGETFKKFPEGRDLVARYKRGEISEEDFKRIAGVYPSTLKSRFTPEFIGSTLQLIPLLATASQGPLGSIGQALWVGAIKYGTAAVGYSMQNRQSIEEALVSIPSRTLVGVLTEITAYGIGKAFSSLFTKAPEKLYRGTLKPEPIDLGKPEFRQPDLAKQALTLDEKGYSEFGTDIGIFNKALDGVETMTKAVDDLAADAAKQGKVVDGNIAMDVMDEEAFKATEAGNMDLHDRIREAQAQLKYFWKARFGPKLEIPVDEAHTYVKNIWGELGNNSTVDVRPSASHARWAAAGAIREAMGEVSPELDAAIAELQYWTRLTKATSDHIFKSTADANLIAGAVLGGASSASVAAVSGVWNRFLNTHFGARSTAIMLDGVREFVEKTPLVATTLGITKDVLRVGLYSIINYLLNEIQGKPQKERPIKKKKSSPKN